MSTADLDKVGKVDELRISHVKALVTKLGGLGPVKAILRGEVEVQLKDSRAHFVQAEILWNKGFGRQIGCRSFTAYVRSIPELPERPENLPQHFKPVLVDTRIVRSEQYGGLVKVCKLLGVAFDGDNSSFIPYDPKHEVKEDVYWVWCQVCKQGCNKSVQDHREQFAKTNEIGLDVMEGLAFFAQSPDVIRDRHMNLPNSVRINGRGSCAYLGFWDGRPGLSSGWYSLTFLHCASASRWAT